MNGNAPTTTVERVTYSGGVLDAAVRVEQDGVSRTLRVTLTNLPQAAATSLLGALEQVLGGGVVMASADVLAIRDSLDNSRGLASFLAPEHDEATLAIAAIESARAKFRLAQQLHGVVS